MRQRTFYVEGEKIQIKSRPRSYMGNPCGFYVWVNGQRFHSAHLERQKAEDHIYIRWVSEQ